MDNRRITCVFGARRTGTNYLEALLETNFGTELQVANLNREQTRALTHRPHLFEAIGSKHEMADRPFQEKFKAQNLNVFIARRPRSWTEARIRYAVQYLGLTSGQITEATIGKWIAQEYVAFYSGLAKRLPDIPNSGVITYEGLLEDYASALGRLASDIGLSDRQLINLKTRVKPAGGQGGGAFEPASSQKEFAARIQEALDAALPNGLVQLFYGVDAPHAG